MADRVRLQIKTVTEPETWEDVGDVGESIPVRLVDSEGNEISITEGKLDVNASLDTEGLATEDKQDEIIEAIENKEIPVVDVSDLATSNKQLPDNHQVQVSNFPENQSVITTNSLITSPYDYIGVTYPDSVTEVYTYKSGGSSGTEVGVLTVTYQDSSKLILKSVAVTHND